MFTRSTKRTLAMLIAALLALTLCAQAMAEEFTVYAASDGALVYDASGIEIGTLQANTALSLTGIWGKLCRVERDGKVAYMQKADLSRTQVTPTVVPEATAQPADTTAPEALVTPEPTATPEPKSVTAYVNKDGAKVYDEGGRAVGSLDLNAEVAVTGLKNDVCRISYNGATGFMRRTDLSASAVTVVATPEPEDTQLAWNLTAYVNKDSATVYSAKGKPAGTLEKNAEVTVTAMKGKVCRISYKGKKGYMRRTDLSDTAATAATPAPETEAEAEEKYVTAYVSRNGAQVVDTQGNTLTTLGLNVAVKVTGMKEGVCKVTSGSHTGYMSVSDLSKTKKEVADATKVASGESTVEAAKGTAQEADWFTGSIQKAFPIGAVAQVTDVETGLSWRVKRIGGTNHADCQPLAVADTAVMWRVYGGKWSWDRRAVFVTIDGVNYAASINGMPHGGGTDNDNGFNGHHCIHFTNSLTHGSDKLCPLHQAAIKKAAAATLK